MLVPFNYDLKSRGNDILYRSTTNRNILKLVDKDIALLPRKQSTTSSFNSKEAIVITFNNVPYYDNRNILFRFQTVIATDYKNTYTIFNYDRMDNPGYGNIGYAEPDGAFSCKSTENFNLNGSKLTTSSNVGKPGKFVFLLINCNKNRGTSCFI